MLQALRAAQNSQDRARDAADLRQLMRTALDAKDDLAMFEVLQVARSEMPEAIKALERARERVVEDGQLDTEESTMALPPPQQEEAGKGNGASQFGADTLDREFIETGIVALRRLSKCSVLGLPSWTIKRFEIKLEGKVGVGSFGDVYRGTWRNHTVAVKLLAEMTPSKIFVREVEIWKSLHHPNVLELFGASGASGEPPWFLVRALIFPGFLIIPFFV
jgi:abelson tyrosine-protein kinase 1